jgi:endonuclease YncB( thermonuclease family)
MASLPETPYIYQAEVIEVLDGDSLWLKLSKVFKIDFGFKIQDTIVKETSQNFRLSGINAAELEAPTRKAGESAKALLLSLVEKGPLLAVTHKPDKYGRWLCDLYRGPGPDFLHINAEMLKSMFVVAYGQPPKAEWTNRE